MQSCDAMKLCSCYCRILVSPKLVDWTAVSSKAGELEDTVSNAARDILALASNENAVVGTAVEVKIQMASLEASAILDRATQAITAQTLTEAEAKVLVGELRGTIAKLKGSIQADIVQLTPITAAQIRAVFDVTFDVVALRSQELYVLLGQ